MNTHKINIATRQLTSTPKPVSRDNDIKEVDNLSHLRVTTLDIKLMIELRSMKYKVGPKGMVVWNSKDGYLIELNNTKILDQWIEYSQLKKIILYSLVLPQMAKITNFKRIFFIEESAVINEADSDYSDSVYSNNHKHSGILICETFDTRSDYLSYDDVGVNSLILREGMILACH